MYRYQGVYKLLREPFCHICSNVGVTTEECVWHRELYGFSRIYAMGTYVPGATEDMLSNHILRLKEDRTYATPLGKALALVALNSYKEILGSNLIVPVPLHPDEIKRRGYNQAFELAKVLGEDLNISVVHALIKTKPQDMRPLAQKERREAVRGLYAIYGRQKHQIQGKQILLVDDVATTGFTVSGCSDVLRKSGAEQVNVLVAGRTVLQ